MLVMFVFPDGKVIIASETPIKAEQAEVIRDYVKRWRETEDGILILSGARVEHKVTEVEVDLAEID